MSENKEKLHLELKQLMLSLVKLQKNNPTILDYLPESLRKTIDSAVELLTVNNNSDIKREGNCQPLAQFEKWYEKVKKMLFSSVNTLTKEKLQKFKVDVLKPYQNKPKPNTMSNTALEAYMIGLACSKLIKNNSFSNFSTDLLTETDKKELAEIWQNSLGPKKCLDEGYLPSADFLAKKLLSLYIDSSENGYWVYIFPEMDPGEYSKFNAGYIYFGYNDIRVNEIGIVNTNDQMKCIPLLDDVPDGARVIEVLKDLFGANARLVDLPIKMKLCVELVLSEAVGTAQGSKLVGGLNGWTRVVFDRDIHGLWTQVFAKKKLWDEKLLELGNTNFDFHIFINRLLSKFTLKDLIPND
jgi:hypothetical protein